MTADEQIDLSETTEIPEMAAVVREIYDNILETMGNTPLVRLNRLGRGLRCDLIAKVEYFNPGGSVKDRIGITTIEDAERKGLIHPGGTIVEATSGNTGVGLAMAAILKGYKCIFVMPDKMSDEKIRVLRAYGARVVVTPTNVEPDDPRSYYSVARQIVEDTPNSILANQYHNPINPQSHYDTTGPELWQQTAGQIDVFVCGIGTGGTITGVGRYLKELNPKIQIVAVDPAGSIVHDYFYTGKMGVAESYKIEGIGEDFIPSNYDFDVIDDIVQVTDKEGMLMTRRIVREEGIFSGNSSGAAVAGAIKYATERDLGPEKTVVVLLPDSGSRYLSKVFDDNWMRENRFLESGWEDTSVSAVITRKSRKELLTAHAEDPVGEVVKRLKASDVSQLPVVGERDQLLGIVREVSLLNYLLTSTTASAASVSLQEADVIDRNVPMMHVGTPLETVMSMFSTTSVAVVVEEMGDEGDKHPVGIITRIDLLDFLADRQ